MAYRAFFLGASASVDGRYRPRPISKGVLGALTSTTRSTSIATGPAPTLTPPTRSTSGSYTMPSAAVSDYSGPRPTVVDLSGTKVVVTTGNGTYDWRRSVGGFLRGGSCSSDDQTCSECAKQGIDVVVGVGGDGSPLGLVCEANAVRPANYADADVAITTDENTKAQSIANGSDLFAQPGWEMKRALWQLPRSLNDAAHVLGQDPVAISNPSHIYLTTAMGSQAVSVMQAIQASMSLSPDVVAFLANPSIKTLALAAPAIVHDIAGWLAIQSVSGANGGSFTATCTSDADCPAGEVCQGDGTCGPAVAASSSGSGIGAGAALGIGAAILLLTRL